MKRVIKEGSELEVIEGESELVVLGLIQDARKGRAREGNRQLNSVIRQPAHSAVFFSPKAEVADMDFILEEMDRLGRDIVVPLGA